MVRSLVISHVPRTLRVNGIADQPGPLLAADKEFNMMQYAPSNRQPKSSRLAPAIAFGLILALGSLVMMQGGCAVLAGGAAGAATGYVAGHEAGKSADQTPSENDRE